MDKQKQIEEMAKDLKEEYFNSLVNKLSYNRFAENLYDLGYRKIPENAVVLTEEEYKRLQRRNEICKTCEEIATEMVKKARKETAEKFVERLKTQGDFVIRADEHDAMYYVDLCVWVDEICKELTEVK